VTSSSFNATVTNSLQFIQQQIDANKNTAAFANYKVTSVTIATAASATTSGLSGGAIAVIVIGALAVVVILVGFVYTRLQKSDESVEDVDMNAEYTEYKS